MKFARCPSRNWGFTLVESVISILLVGLTLFAAVNLLGMSRSGERGTSINAQACALADELMAEILEQDYIDASVRESYYDGVGASGSVMLATGGEGFGPGGTEAATGDRSLFDDVDDYNGWSASPPQDKDGSVRAELSGWSRSVVIERLAVDAKTVSPAQDFGLRRVTVVVSHNGAERCRRIGLKSLGLPPTQACCLPDTSCVDVPTDVCGGLSGTAQGWDTLCGYVTCQPPVTVLMVVQDPASLSAQETDRKTLIESWGYAVNLINDSKPQIDYFSAASQADVAYVSEQVDDTQLASKLVTPNIGVVLEKWELTDEFFLSDDQILKNQTDLRVDDNTHYITANLSLSESPILSSIQPTWMLSGNIAPDQQTLGSMTDGGSGYGKALVVVESGDNLISGQTASGRRVKLPWGGTGLDIGQLNPDGESILQRSLLWAGGKDLVCGDSICVSGEDPCTCPTDCGAPDASEVPNLTCQDGLNNDCDGFTDCMDPNCGADPACLLPSCGNTTCEVGEDCNSCIDCAGKSNGPALGRFCCGDGIAQTAEGDGTICDGNY